MNLIESIVKISHILNLTGSSVEKAVLDQMDAQDPEVAESGRNLMYVFGDIVKLTDRELQTLLREVDQKDLVVALKSAEDELKGQSSRQYVGACSDLHNRRDGVSGTHVPERGG